MTYVVGFKQPGFNAIISDARISRREPDGRRDGSNTALKVGVLFPGCIFGRSGDDGASREFILNCRDSVMAEPGSIRGYWRRFERFIGSYCSQGHDTLSYELLLSSRASGEPRFYILDSKMRVTELSDKQDFYSVSIGSGKDFLDERYVREMIPRLKQAQRRLVSQEHWSLDETILISPYYLCLWLSERSCTFEKPTLEDRYGVGGVFSFIGQTTNWESMQGPSVFIFSARDRQTGLVDPWLYRVSSVRGGLCIDTCSPSYGDPGALCDPERMALFDVGSWPGAATVEEIDEELKNRIFKERDSLPFFHFCGFGFTPPPDRRSLFAIISRDGKGRKEEILDDDGRLRPEVMSAIVRNFALAD